MRTLSDADLLDLWEQGVRRHPLDRALLILAAVLPDVSYDDLADWPLGRRNRGLAALRCRWFGANLQGWSACPRCGAELECGMDCRVLAHAGPEGDMDYAEPIVVNGRRFRLPTSRDLAAILQEADLHRASMRLVDHCLLDASAPHAWSDAELEEIGERMALADPQAEMRVTLHCPECAHAWDETLDITSFLWTEIEGRARRLLFEIHVLASAYGWTEAVILSLGPQRRALYLEMVQA